MLYKIPCSVLVVIHTKDLHILLLDRCDRPGFWQSVTGSLDYIDEEPILAAQREVYEETGIVCDRRDLVATGVVTRYEIFSHWRHRYAPGVTENIETTFTLEVPKITSIRLQPREHINYEWCAPELAAQRCFSPSNAAAIRALASL